MQKHSTKKKLLKISTNKEAANAYTEPSTKFSEEEIQAMPNDILRDGSKNGEFFNLSQEADKKFNVPDSTIRVFSSKLFESGYKDYNKDEIQKQKEDGYTFLKEVKSGSIILGNNVTIYINFKNTKYLGKKILPNSKISYFPLPGNIDDTPRYFIVFKGEGYIYKAFNFEGKEIKATNKIQSVKSSDFENISILVGNNTILDLELDYKEINGGGAMDYYTNKQFSFTDRRNVQLNKPEKYQYSTRIINPNIFPEPQQNCALLFSNPISKLNKISMTVCYNLNKKVPDYYMYKEDKDGNITIQDNKLKNQKIMAAIVPKKATLLLIVKKEVNGVKNLLVTPIKDKVSNINTSTNKTINGFVHCKNDCMTETNYRYFEFLKSGCFSIFSEKGYFNPILSHCCNIKDLSRVDIKEKENDETTIIKSILIGKDTVISIFTQPNYKGEEFVLHSSIDDYSFYSKNPISIGSIKIHN